MSCLETNPCGADGVSAHSTGQEEVVKAQNTHGKSETVSGKTSGVSRADRGLESYMRLTYLSVGCGTNHQSGIKEQTHTFIQ